MYKKQYEHIWTDILNRDINDLYCFDDNLMKEGLIRSWDNDIFIKFLDKILRTFDNTSYNIEIDSETVILRIFNFDILHKGLKKKLYEEIKKLLNQSGYYVSGKYELVKFIENSEKYLELEFNMKFNSENGIPSILYHITYKRFINKIKDIGLVTKSNKSIDNHPDRIYFTDNIKDAIKFAKSKYLLFKDDEYSDYIILEIDTKKLNKIKIYNDPLRIPNTNMYYTYDNIPSYSINDINEHSLNEYNRYLKINKINNMKILKLDEFVNESKSYKYKFGCVMLELTVDKWNDKIHSIIDEDDIYDEEGFGLEDKCHVTVFFGIVSEESETKEVIEKIKECDIDINKEYLLENISIFKNDDYDVVKFDIKKCRNDEDDELENCKGLKEMNKFIKQTFPNEQTHPDYKPHVTIGYVLPKKGKNYIQDLDDPIIAKPSKLVYSYPIDNGKNKRTITIIDYEKLNKN